MFDNPELLEVVLSSVAALVATLWASVKASKQLRERKQRKWYAAIELLEVAVESTYQSYVREIKKSREDGKLTADEQKEARNRALASAHGLASTRGVDLANELGNHYVEFFIQRVAQNAKNSYGDSLSPKRLEDPMQ